MVRVTIRCADVVLQTADALEMAADLREIAVVPLLRGGEHRGGLAVVRRDVDHYPDNVAPLLGDLEVGGAQGLHHEDSVCGGE
ncbi:MAG TPA: hypothetical protein VGM79_29305 [Streptosporangiaceae bacterium]|jgi:hypothetical protein